MKIQIALFVGLSFLLSLSANGREAKTINDGWTFSQAGRTEAVHLPHSWNGDAYSTSDYYRGQGSYTRHIRVPEVIDGNRAFLQLDGAASKSKVLIDSREAGSHVGAYSTHVVDITPFVADGLDHELTVIVDNSDPAIPPYSADFTFMGGLYRDVSLVLTDPVYLNFNEGPVEGFKTAVTKLAGDEWAVDVSGVVSSAAASKSKVRVIASLRDTDGREIAAKSRIFKINPGQSADFSLTLNGIVNPALWSPESPTLYTVAVIVESDGKAVDTDTAGVGFRTFAFDSEGRFLLNGQPYKLRGMCRHQDQAPMGIALTDEMHRRDMRMIKDMGANFIRISHYPQDDAILEMCDRLGLIAWEEVPVIDYVPLTEGFADNAETMVRDMIRRHYNHPSVAMWGYMNEILLRVPAAERDSAYARTISLARRLEDVVRSEDPHRLSTIAFHGSDAYHDASLSGITDAIGWNLYQGWYGGSTDEFEEFLSRQHREHPEQKIIVSEYGAGSDPRIHSLAPRPFDFSIEYQQDFLEHYLPVIEDSAFVAGASHWNFIDFSSANRAEATPHINNKGLVTNRRVPKDVYYYYCAKWHDAASDTAAHIAVNDWLHRVEVPDADGMAVRPVKIYTNLPAVSLNVNGVPCGSKAVDNCTAIFDVNLSDGRNILEVYSSDGRILDTKVVEAEIFEVSDGMLRLRTGELAINAGSNCYFRSDDSGVMWLPDVEYTPSALYGHVGGKEAITQDAIALTPDHPLFQRAITGLEEYRVALEPGQYEVELLFADHGKPSAMTAYLLGHKAGSESDSANMNISINGRTVETDFSPAESVGPKAMLRRRYFTEVKGSEGLTVSFDGVSTLAGIKIRKK